MSDPNASPQQLRKALEWELSLDNRDLRSHAWYHGSIPRGRAEELILQDGDFLIRDCISQPGDFVLTCRWKGLGLHFVINKVSKIYTYGFASGQVWMEIVPHAWFSYLANQSRT